MAGESAADSRFAWSASSCMLAAVALPVVVLVEVLVAVEVVASTKQSQMRWMM